MTSIKVLVSECVPLELQHLQDISFQAAAAGRKTELRLPSFSLRVCCRCLTSRVRGAAGCCGCPKPGAMPGRGPGNPPPIKCMGMKGPAEAPKPPPCCNRDTILIWHWHYD